MSTDLQPRIVSAPGLLLAGIRRQHFMRAAATTIPAQWEEFRSGGYRETRAPRAFGVMCGVQGDEFEYMTALEVDNFDRLPESLGRMRVPAQQYAVFWHPGHASEAAELWQRIMSEWLPQSGFEDAETPAFELYDQRFDPDTGAGGFEIWFPIRRRT